MMGINAAAMAHREGCRVPTSKERRKDDVDDVFEPDEGNEFVEDRQGDHDEEEVGDDSDDNDSLGLVDNEDSSDDDDGEDDDRGGGGRGGGGGVGKYKKSFMSDSMHGSRRHLKKLAVNGLTVVSEKGSPDCFITATVNIKWPDLSEALPPGQTAYDNPLITNRIFKKRLDALIANLRSGYYFGNRKIVYDLRVIEYQHRGLPHAHIVFKLVDCDFDDEMILCFFDKSYADVIVPL